MMTADCETRFSSSYLSWGERKDPSLVLIVLNWHLSPLTAKIWDRASVRICADGGANRLYDQVVGWESGLDPITARRKFAPDLIKGDLDSIRADVKDFYEANGVRVVDLSHDQETTDLQKCLTCAAEKLGTPARLSEATVVAVGGLGGRLDHTMSNLNTLYRLAHMRLVLCGDGNLAQLVPAGRTVIQLDPRYEGPACGLVALGAPARVTTTGLQWNCEDIVLEVGGMQSTSNKVAANEITIVTDHPLIWTIELQEDRL